jgi:hypothetical protein
MAVVEDLAANMQPLMLADVPAALATGLRGKIAMATRRDAARERLADGVAPGTDHAAAAAAAEPTSDQWVVLGDDPELAAAAPVEPVEPAPAAEASAASAVAVELPPPATPARDAQHAATQTVPLPPPPATVQPVLHPMPDWGAWITTTGSCMHTSKKCDGMKTAGQIRWATFHQQREAMLQGVTEAWTKKNDLNGMLCLREHCVDQPDGPCNVGSLRKLRWCLTCGRHPVARIRQ